MRVGLAGLGHQGRRYAAIVKPSVVLRRGDDLAAFLDNCDAVIVATPVETHYGIVIRALLAGKRVLCEKPLCDRVADLRSIERTAKPGQLTVGYTQLWHPSFEEMRKRAEAERTQEISVVWMGPRGNALDWAPHAVAFAAALAPSDGMALTFGEGDKLGELTAEWKSGMAQYRPDHYSPEPPLTRMVNWWLLGQQDYRSELWRRVEPAVLGLCGGAA